MFYNSVFTQKLNSFYFVWLSFYSIFAKDILQGKR